MTTTQRTLVQIDNYGPWTVNTGSRRETDLQTLQARLFADLAQFVGNRDGDAFFTRFDNMVAVTNGLDRDDHALLQQSIANRYPVSVSLPVAVDSSPVAALGDATEAFQKAGSAQDSDRRAALCGQTLPEDTRNDDEIRVVHFDIVDATNQHTDELNAIDVLARVQRTCLELSEYMRETTDAVSFFTGGDNFIAVCPPLDRESDTDVVEHVGGATGVELQAGVGHGSTARDAGAAAKHALGGPGERLSNGAYAVRMARG